MTMLYITDPQSSFAAKCLLRESRLVRQAGLCEGRPVTLPAPRPFSRPWPARAHTGFFLKIRPKARAGPPGLSHKPGFRCLFLGRAGGFSKAWPGLPGADKLTGRPSHKPGGN
ncbi:unnamed protein product [Caenorhabditis auriculariae]|uniref:Uncharacterized protein n=1 Tax=Caenorhabditis auriculariae TaxID=2777116 RepID=A0A8S1HM06_9PELO|nr:unnamed protein product [Caenorhabditis auriculariae]